MLDLARHEQVSERNSVHRLQNKLLHLIEMLHQGRADGPTKMFEMFSLIGGEIVKTHAFTTLAAERINLGSGIVGSRVGPGDVAVGPSGQDFGWFSQ